jgi:hypothetical protein
MIPTGGMVGFPLDMISAKEPFFGGAFASAETGVTGLGLLVPRYGPEDTELTINAGFSALATFSEVPLLALRFVEVASFL